MYYALLFVIFLFVAGFSMWTYKGVERENKLPAPYRIYRMI